MDRIRPDDAAQNSATEHRIQHQALLSRHLGVDEDDWKQGQANAAAKAQHDARLVEPVEVQGGGEHGQGDGDDNPIIELRDQLLGEEA